MKYRILAFLLVFSMCLSLNNFVTKGNEVDGAESYEVKEDKDSATDEKTVTLLKADFDAAGDNRPTWNQVGNNTNGAVGYGTRDSGSYANITRYMELPFDTVALTEAGGESFGANQKLTAEYKIAKTAAGAGNFTVYGITNSTADADSFAFSENTVHDSNTGTRPLFYYIGGMYGNDVDTANPPVLYDKADGSSGSVGLWVQFKHVVTITDDAGNFLDNPAVDIFVTDADANWEYPAVPVYSGYLLAPLDSVDVIRVGSSGGGPRAGIDDVYICLTYEARDEDQPGLDYKIPDDADENSRFVTVTGGRPGQRDGKTWETAWAGSQLQYAWDNTPASGTLYIGSGTYENAGLSIAAVTGGIGPTGSYDDKGNEILSFKKLIGFETEEGSGKPEFIDTRERMLSDAVNNVRYPSKCSNNVLISIGAGAGYVWIENLHVVEYYRAIHSKGPNTGLRIYDISVIRANNSIMLEGGPNAPIRDVVIENCYFFGFVKSGVRVSQNIQNVLFKDCVADAGGEPEYIWGAWPVGFQMESGDSTNGWEKDIVYVNCISLNGFQAPIKENPNGDDDMRDYNSGVFWNGDGFTSERGSRDLTFIRSAAIGSTDGGWDLKADTALFLDCISLDNKGNYKLWALEEAILINCLSAYTFRRGGTGEGNGIESAGGNITLYNCTVMEAEEYEFRFSGSGSYFGNITVNDSVIVRSPVKMGTPQYPKNTGAGTSPASGWYVDRMQDGIVTFNNSIIYTNGYDRQEHPNLIYNNTEIIKDGDPGIIGYAGAGAYQSGGIFPMPSFNVTNIYSFLDDVYVNGIFNSKHGPEKGFWGYTVTDPDSIRHAKYPVVEDIVITAENDPILKNDIVTLTVSATTEDIDGVLTYQWYKNTMPANFGGMRIQGETGVSYQPPTNVPGAMYYYVEVTNTIESKGFKTPKTTSRYARVFVVGEPDIDPDAPKTKEILLLSEDFESYVTAAEFTGTGDGSGALDWYLQGTVSEGPNIVLTPPVYNLGTRVRLESTSARGKYAYIHPQAASVRYPLGVSIALTQAGAAELGVDSPGANAKLVTEYKMAKMAGMHGNYLPASFTNETVLPGREAFGASILVRNSASGLFRYANSIGSTDQPPLLHLGEGDVGADPAKSVGLWVQFKFVVTITDSSGNYITPKIDIYVTDESDHWQYSATPTYSGSLLNAHDYINSLSFISGGSSTHAGIDDIKVYLIVDDEEHVSFENAVPSAAVTVLPGNQNLLSITITEHYSDGSTKDIVWEGMIKNNAEGIYEVGRYRVFVNTKGNNQIRQIYIVE